MKKSVTNTLVFIMIGLFILPNFVSALDISQYEDKIQLEDNAFILKSLLQDLSDNKMEAITDGRDFSRKQEVALLLLFKSIVAKSTKFIFWEVGKDVINTTLTISSFLLSQNIGDVLKEIEKMTVEAAKEKAMEWLLQNELKVAKGNLEISYVLDLKMPYIIVYDPINYNQGNVAIEVYSSKTIKLPPNYWSYAQAEYLDYVDPFIIRIGGVIEKKDRVVYKWIEDPYIEIIFDEPVPDFEFEEPTFFSGIQDSWDRFAKAIGNLLGDLKKVYGDLKDELVETWEGVMDFFSKLNPLRASIVQEQINREERGEFFQEELNLEEREEFEEEIDNFIEKLEIEEIIELADSREDLDDIAEKIDSISQKIENLIKQIPVIGKIKEDKVDNKQEPELEDIEEIEEIEEEKEENEEENAEEDTVEDLEEYLEIKLAVEEKEEKTEPRRGTSFCSFVNSMQSARDKVIINEIAWMGTKASSNDEWVELKNISNNEVDISGWQIVDKTSQIEVVIEDYILAPNEFYLLERTDDNSVPSITADAIYVGALNNSEESLYLFNKECQLEDMIIAGPDWPAGDSANKLSMERGSDLNWHTYSGEGNGTPKAENSLPIEPEPEPEEIDILGCMDDTALNYNPEATIDDGSCEYSDEPKPVSEEPSLEIIINEIAWMGTKASSNDEWIELYNPNSESIDVLDWKMLFYPVGETSPRAIDLVSTLEMATPSIDGLSYFLLERTDDTTISDIEADYIYTGALNNEGGTLELRDNNSNLVDRVVCLDDWCAGDNDNKISMERNNEEWLDNNLFVYNGRDADNNNVWGTPKQENSNKPSIEIKNLPFDILDEIVLTKSNSPYLIKTTLIVPEEKVLVIEPGTVLLFYDEHSKIIVNGTLKAIGVEEEKIIFTSFKDEDYGVCDDPTCPSRWGQIIFSETSIDSELNNILLRYGGDVPGLSPCDDNMGAIKIDKSSIVLKDSIIEQCFRRGVYLIDSSSIIDNVEFLNTQICCPECANKFGGYGLEVLGGESIISNSLFKGNRTGISVRKGENIGHSLIKNNIFENNEIAVSIYRSVPSFENNQAVNNDINGISITDSILEDMAFQADLTYIIKSNVNVLEGVVLTIEPGSVVKFYNGYSKIIIEGTLKANDVVFTSFKDDEYGGDTNNDANTALPMPGDWGQLYFKEKSIDSELNNIVLRYGGEVPSNTSPCDPDMAGIRVENSSIILSNSVLEYNQYKGLGLSNSASVVDNVGFYDNPFCYEKYGSYGITIDEDQGSIISNSSFIKHRTGINIRSGDPVLDNLSFEDNECNIYKANECIDPVLSP